VTKWRYFADRELPRVIRELGIPCAEPVRVTGMTRCPRHQERLGSVTRTCLACHDEAWDEVARRYRAQGRPVLQDVPDDERLARVVRSHSRSLKEENMTTANSDELLEGELVPDICQPPATPGLFGTDNPGLVIAKATEISDELARVLRDRHLCVSISGKEHVRVEGWTLLGSMFGVFPVTVWSRRFEDGWEARVEARTLAGAVVGAAESECLRGERRWAKADDYAIRSMAATRATSKALRQPLGFVMQLAGFEATPAEEIPAEASYDPRPANTPPPAKRASHEQLTRIGVLLSDLARHDPNTDWRAKARDLAGVPADTVTIAVADELIRRLEAEMPTTREARS
jgi:hypothetical protein